MVRVADALPVEVTPPRPSYGETTNFQGALANPPRQGAPDLAAAQQICKIWRICSQMHVGLRQFSSNCGSCSVSHGTLRFQQKASPSKKTPHLGACGECLSVLAQLGSRLPPIAVTRRGHQPGADMNAQFDRIAILLLGIPHSVIIGETGSVIQDDTCALEGLL